MNSKNTPNLSIEYHMLYVEIRKSLRFKREKKIIICRVYFFDTRQRTSLPSVIFLTLGKEPFCRVFYFYRLFSVRHSAKSLFAECPKYSTQQTLMHSANKGFPVVTASRLLRHPVPQLPWKFMDSRSRELNLNYKQAVLELIGGAQTSSAPLQGHDAAVWPLCPSHAPWLAAFAALLQASRHCCGQG